MYAMQSISLVISTEKVDCHVAKMKEMKIIDTVNCEPYLIEIVWSWTVQ